MDPLTYSVSAAASASIQPVSILTKFLNWMKGKKKVVMTFNEYFRKMQREFKTGPLSQELKEKFLGSINQKQMSDGRIITVDYTKNRIFVGKLDDF